MAKLSSENLRRLKEVQLEIDELIKGFVRTYRQIHVEILSGKPNRFPIKDSPARARDTALYHAKELYDVCYGIRDGIGFIFPELREIDVKGQLYFDFYERKSSHLPL